MPIERAFGAAVLSILFLVSGQASAQSYPTKPVRLIAPFLPGGTSDVLSRLLDKRLGFDPDNDFAPISMVARSGPVLIVHPSVPARSVRELIALARARPAQLNFGSGGRGTPAHMAGEILKAGDRSATGITRSRPLRNADPRT